MNQILASAHVTTILPMLFECGLTAVLFPFLDKDALGPTTGLLHDLSTKALPQSLGNEPIWGDLRWFTFFYWGGNRLTEEDMKQRINQMRFSRKGARMMQSLAQCLNLHPDDPERLFLALQWHEQGLLTADFLEFYLEHLSLHFPQEGASPNLAQLLSALGRVAPFETPREALMTLPPAIRGESVKVAKIYWYLELCRDSNEVAKVLTQVETFIKQLQSGTMKPVN